MRRAEYLEFMRYREPACIEAVVMVLTKRYAVPRIIVMGFGKMGGYAQRPQALFYAA
jgi:hypothetical protein